MGLAKHLNFIIGLCRAANNTTMVHIRRKLWRGNGAGDFRRDYLIL